jgi:hypothetical protein
MNKVTASEIAPLLMIDESKVAEILKELAQEGKLIAREDLIYFYKEQEVKHRLPLFFEYHKPEEIDLILRCFCTEIPIRRTMWLFNISKKTVFRFYSYFRELIYNKQLSELEKHFSKNPLLACERTFIGVVNFMYYYNGKTYISKKKLQHTLPEKPFPKTDMLEFKKDYSKLTRRVNHNTMCNFVHLHLAEQIFRLNNDYDSVYEELIKLL